MNNSQRIYEFAKGRKAVTTAEIGRALGISTGSVVSALSSLRSSGLIEVAGEIGAGRGRSFLYRATGRKAHEELLKLVLFGSARRAS